MSKNDVLQYSVCLPSYKCWVLGTEIWQYNNITILKIAVVHHLGLQILNFFTFNHHYSQILHMCTIFCKKIKQYIAKLWPKTSFYNMQYASAFQQRCFVVHKTNHNFSAIARDQAHERQMSKYNATVKGTAYRWCFCIVSLAHLWHRDTSHC